MAENPHLLGSQSGKVSGCPILFTSIKPTPDTTALCKWGSADKPIQIYVKLENSIKSLDFRAITAG